MGVDAQRRGSGLDVASGGKAAAATVEEAAPPSPLADHESLVAQYAVMAHAFEPRGVDLVLRLLDRKDLVPDVRNEANHEILRQFLDCSKARQLLSWRPRYTMDEGLRETITWYRQWLLQPDGQVGRVNGAAAAHAH